MQQVLVPQTEQNPDVLTVALVATDDALRSSVRLLLTVSGMVVHEYRTAQAFLAADSGAYSCLVVDCQLADMPGRQLCMETIRQNGQVPIVVLAAAPEAFELTDAARAKVRLVSKPFEGELLIGTIEESAGAGPENREPPLPYPAVS